MSTYVCIQYIYICMYVWTHILPKKAKTANTQERNPTPQIPNLMNPSTLNRNLRR